MMRCIEVSFAAWAADTNAVVHRAMCIQSRLGVGGRSWEYGETRWDDPDNPRIAYYADFESDQQFDSALAALQKWLGDDRHAVEVGCRSAYGDDGLSLAEV